MSKSVTVSISKLDLDLQNPRYEVQNSQREALERILLDNSEKTIKLAENIIQNGQNPIDIIAVIESSNNRYTVIEGNRRVAVIKILSKPVLLDSIPAGQGVAPFLKKMKQLAGQASEIDFSQIKLVLFSSREEANMWVKLKHTGENDGAGTVQWDGTQRARFRKGDVGLRLLDFGKSQNWFTDSDLTIRGAFPISTFNRLLSDPSVRNILGLELSSGALNSLVARNELAKGVKKIVFDLAEGSWNVSKLKSKADRQNYIEQLPKESLPDVTNSETPWAIDHEAPEKELKKNSIVQNIRVQKTIRNTLIPKTFKVNSNINSPRLGKIITELKSLSVEKHENAIAVLLRTLIELSVDDFIARKNITVIQKNVKAYQPTLANKVNNVAAYFREQKKLDKAQEHIVNRLTGNNDETKADCTNITTLHSFVHSRHASPIGTELKTIWDNVATFMELVLNIK